MRRMLMMLYWRFKTRMALRPIAKQWKAICKKHDRDIKEMDKTLRRLNQRPYRRF